MQTKAALPPAATISEDGVDQTVVDFHLTYVRPILDSLAMLARQRTDYQRARIRLSNQTKIGETDRDSLKGIDYLINRTHYLVHPNGISWVGNAAGNSPSNAELATGTNWSKVFTDNRNIRITQLRCYI